VRWLQEAAGVVAADGVIGPKTLEAVNDARKGRRRRPLEGRRRRPLQAVILAKRLVFLGELITRDPRQAVFAKGWMARVAEFL
jgi:lysozyme family protein